MRTVLLLALLPATALAQAGSLSGRVTDSAGAPLPLAAVEVLELSHRAFTGAGGTYRLTINNGRYTVVVRAAGFEPAVREVAIAGATTLDVTLLSRAFLIEPVTVTATRAPLSAGESPLAVTTLSRDEVRRVQGTSLAHVLENLAGVRTLSTGAQIGKPVIRGVTGSRVLVLENGSRLEDYSWSDEDGPSVETGFVRRVEVIRGPASVLYGSDALGGVVNVLSEPLPDPAATLRAGLTLSGQSNNTEMGIAARAEGWRGSLGWRFAAVGRVGGDLHTPDGPIENTGFGSANLEAGLGSRTAGGEWSLRVVHYGGEFKLLEADAPPGGGGAAEAGPERKLADERVQLRGEKQLGTWRLETAAQFQRHDLIEMSDDTVPGGGGSVTETEAFNLLLQTALLDVLAHHTSGRVRGTLGVSGLAQTNDAGGRIPLIPDASISSAAAFGFEQLRLGTLSLLVGGRVDARHLSADADSRLGVSAQTRNYAALSGDLGMVWRAAPDVSVHGNFGRGWRAPTLFELFANGPHLGEARYERGDSTLDTEHGRNVDLGVRWSTRRMRVELNAYQNRFFRYIFLAPTNQFVGPLRVYQHTQADAELLGGEAAIEAVVRAPLTISARVDGVRGTNLSAHEPLPLVPPLRTVVGVDWGDVIGMDIENFARQDRLNPLDVPTAGYTLVHLSGGAALRLLGRSARLDFAVRNVFNTRYRSFLSRYKEFATDPGRNIILRLSVGYVD